MALRVVRELVGMHSMSFSEEGLEVSSEVYFTSNSLLFTGISW